MRDNLLQEALIVLVVTRPHTAQWLCAPESEELRVPVLGRGGKAALQGQGVERHGRNARATPTVAHVSAYPGSRLSGRDERGWCRLFGRVERISRLFRRVERGPPFAHRSSSIATTASPAKAGVQGQGVERHGCDARTMSTVVHVPAYPGSRLFGRDERGWRPLPTATFAIATTASPAKAGVQGQGVERHGRNARTTPTAVHVSADPGSRLFGRDSGDGAGLFGRDKRGMAAACRSARTKRGWRRFSVGRDKRG